MKRGEVERGIVARLGNAQNWLCFHCGKPMLKTSARKPSKGGVYDNGWTREHVVPKALGGYNRGNVVLAHLQCNSERGKQAPGPHMMQRAMAIWKKARTVRQEPGDQHG